MGEISSRSYIVVRSLQSDLLNRQHQHHRTEEDMRIVVGRL